MEVKFNVKGKERKNLAIAIGEIMDSDVTYKGVPTCAYEVKHFIIDRFGTLSFEDKVSKEEVEKLLEQLGEKGFIGDAITKEESTQSEAMELAVAMPRTYFTEDSFSKLEHLIEAKGRLIKKALGIDSLPIKTDGEKITFPWFPTVSQDSEVINAYTHFVIALCEMAKNQKRINANEKEIENEKYAFRCFLLRLGFIGNEYKEERKILLRNLTGSAAFKGGAKREISK